MNAYDLFNAIGSAADTYLMEIEGAKIRPLPRRFGLIAALITILLTACAAPTILQHFDALQSGGIINDESIVTWDELWENPESHWVDGDYIILRPSTVGLNVNVLDDAPETIAQPCMPLALLDYAAIENGTLTETSLSVEFSAKVPRHGQIRGILYRQDVLPRDGHIKLDNFVDYGPMKEQMKSYGNIAVLEIEGDTCYPLLDDPKMQPSIYTKHLFWSDGHYLYCLKLPITYNLPVSAVERIITSLTAVEDITQYLTP